MKGYGTSSMFPRAVPSFPYREQGLTDFPSKTPHRCKKGFGPRWHVLRVSTRTEPLLLKPYLAFGVKLSRATSLVEILICWLTERPMEMASDSMNTAALANSSLLMSYDESVGEV